MANKFVEHLKTLSQEEAEAELRQLLENPDVMHEVMKNAYIPTGLSDVDMIDAVLQNADPTEPQICDREDTGAQ